MNPILRNVLVFIGAVILGGMLNGQIISLGMNLIAPPEGVNTMDVESINENIHRYELIHFVTPFLAHALGALFAGFLAAKLAVSHQMKLAIAASGFFIIGGIMMAMMIPNAPIWFTLLDLIGAYFPMGWLGWKLAGAPKNEVQDVRSM